MFYMATMVLWVVGTMADSNKEAHRKLEPRKTPPYLQVISRKGYALGFDSKTRQPLWVAYRLRKSDTEAVCERVKCFKKDALIDDCPEPQDYCYSGFERGHMAPCEDMLYSTNRMVESFIMSNMSPQYMHVNRGVWKSVEEHVHKWAMKFGEIYVVDGPIFDGTDDGIETGKGLIVKPCAFYKIIYTKRNGGMMLAFQVENKENGLEPFTSNPDLYVRSVKRIEDVTGFSFFDDICLSDNIEELKAQDDIGIWW